MHPAISERVSFYQLYDTAARYSIDMCNTANMTDLYRDKAGIRNGQDRAIFAISAGIDTLIFFSKIASSIDDT